MSGASKRTFCLNTTSSLFLDWCWRYAQRWPGTERGHWPTEAAEVHLVGGCYHSWAALGGNRLDSFELEGFVATPFEDGGKRIESMSMPFSIIEMRTVPLSRERCEVQASCRFAPALPLFEELLRAIAERWPEAATQLVAEGEPEAQAPAPEPAESERAPSRGRPRLEDAADWPAKLEKVGKWEARIAKGESPEVAAGMVGEAPRTLRSWAKRRDELARQEMAEKG